VRSGKTVFAVAVATAVLSSLAGCGGGGSGSSSGTTPTGPAETIDPAAKPPRGWQTYISPVAGFSVSVPPAWTVAPSGGSSLLSSPDKVVAISITADRTGEALDAPLESYAADTLKNLSGFSGLTPTGVRPYKAQYPAAIATADGTLASSGVKQRLTLVVLRREGIAAYPVLASRNAGVSSPFVKQVDAVIHSLRGRPVEGSG
jgi:hypothetical protein